MMPPQVPDEPTPGATSKTAKIDLSFLPKGVLIGDTVQMVVENIDAAQNTATLMVPEGLKGPEASDDSEDANPADDSSQTPATTDTKVLLGPMKGLKNYLVKKSQDNSASGTH
jgi:hypothetical protein